MTFSDKAPLWLAVGIAALLAAACTVLACIGHTQEWGPSIGLWITVLICSWITVGCE